jgi:hypothetical protein
MHLLLWLLWFVATFEEEGGELAAPGPFFCLRLVHVRLCPPKLDLTDSNNARQFYGLLYLGNSNKRPDSFMDFILVLAQGIS